MKIVAITIKITLRKINRFNSIPILTLKTEFNQVKSLHLPTLHVHN